MVVHVDNSVLNSHHVIQKDSTPDGGDFEVVPAAVPADDVDMWDAEDNNEDEIKQEHIRSMPSVAH